MKQGRQRKPGVKTFAYLMSELTQRDEIKT